MSLPPCVEFKGYYFGPCKFYEWNETEIITVSPPGYSHDLMAGSRCIHRMKVQSVDLEVWVMLGTSNRSLPVSCRVSDLRTRSCLNCHKAHCSRHTVSCSTCVQPALCFDCVPFDRNQAMWESHWNGNLPPVQCKECRAATFAIFNQQEADLVPDLQGMLYKSLFYDWKSVDRQEEK